MVATDSDVVATGRTDAESTRTGYAPLADELARVHVSLPAGLVVAIERRAAAEGVAVSVLTRRLLAEGMGYVLPATMTTGKRARVYYDTATGDRIRRAAKKTRLETVREKLAALRAVPA